MTKFWLLGAAGIAAACSTKSTIPADDPATLPPVEESRDWNDWGREENMQRRIQGRALTGEEITARLVGSTLNGCYAGGDSLTENLTQDGNVVDPRTGQTLAQYRVNDDKLCFAYPQQNVACYTVTAADGGLYFYTAGGYRLVAATVCPIPADAKGLAG